MPYTATLGVLTHDTNGATITIRHKYADSDDHYIDCEFARRIADILNKEEEDKLHSADDMPDGPMDFEADEILGRPHYAQRNKELRGQ